MMMMMMKTILLLLGLSYSVSVRHTTQLIMAFKLLTIMFYESLFMLITSRFTPLFLVMFCIIGLSLILILISSNLINLKLKLQSKSEKDFNFKFILKFLFYKILLSAFVMLLIGLALKYLGIFFDKIPFVYGFNIYLITLLFLLLFAIGISIFYKKNLKNFLQIHKGKYAILLKIFINNWLFLIILRFLLIWFAYISNSVWILELLNLTLFNVIFIPCLILLPIPPIFGNILIESFFNYIQAQPTDEYFTPGIHPNDYVTPRTIAEWRNFFQTPQNKWPDWDDSVLRITVGSKVADRLDLCLRHVKNDFPSLDGLHFLYFNNQGSITYAIPFKYAHLLRWENRGDTQYKFVAAYKDIGIENANDNTDNLAREIYWVSEYERRKTFVANRQQGRKISVHRFVQVFDTKQFFYRPIPQIVMKSVHDVYVPYDPLNKNHELRPLFLTLDHDQTHHYLGRSSYSPLNKMNRITRVRDNNHQLSYLNIPQEEYDDYNDDVD